MHTGYLHTVRFHFSIYVFIFFLIDYIETIEPSCARFKMNICFRASTLFFFL